MRLENRTLKLAPDFPGFTYRWCKVRKNKLFKRCKKKKLRNCSELACKQWVVDKYDLSDPEVREKLRNMKFEAKSRMKR